MSQVVTGQCGSGQTFVVIVGGFGELRIGHLLAQVANQALELAIDVVLALLNRLFDSQDSRQAGFVGDFEVVIVGMQRIVGFKHERSVSLLRLPVFLSAEKPLWIR